MFQSSSTSEPVPDGRHWLLLAPAEKVSILEHERTRARHFNLVRAGCQLGVSILEHERTRARLTQTTQNKNNLEVSILEHERTRARPLN